MEFNKLCNSCGKIFSWPKTEEYEPKYCSIFCSAKRNSLEKIKADPKWKSLINN